LGDSHDWTVTITKSETESGTWNMTVTDENGHLLSDPSSTDDPPQTTFFLHFDGSGNLTNDVKSLVFGQHVDGANDLQVTMDLSADDFQAVSNGGATVEAKSIDGNAMG